MTWGRVLQQTEKDAVDRLGRHVGVRACTDGRKGQATWPHGELVCYRSTAPKEAKLRWIDERTNTYGVLDATNQDIARLHAVWTKLTD